MSASRYDSTGLVGGDPSDRIPPPPRAAAVRPWADVKRRLAVRLDGAGDVLMTSPALRAMRARHPDEHLALLTSPSGAEAARLLPEVDEVIVYEPPWMPGSRGAGAGPEADLAMAERLRAGRYDGAAIFTVHSQSALPAAMLCHLAGIPRRLAHSLANPYGLVTDWVPDPEPVAPLRHETRRQLDLVAAVGYAADESHLSLHVPPGAVRRMRALLSRLDVRPGEFLLVHPGAAAPSRRWTADGFAGAARAVRSEAGLRTVIAGGAADVETARTIAAAVSDDAIDLAGRLTFAEFAALVAQAPLLLANNSAPAHVAAAIGTPVVVVYAMTNIQHAPWQVPSRVVALDVSCAGCRRSECPLLHHRCMRGIAPATVAAAALDLLAERRGGAPAWATGVAGSRGQCRDEDGEDGKGGEDGKAAVAATAVLSEPVA